MPPSSDRRNFTSEVCFGIIMTISVMAWLASGRGNDRNPSCDEMPDLSLVQRQMCYSQASVLVAISQGLSLGDKECQRQFRNHKWNCTALGKISLLGPRLKIGTKEAAYESAIKSATVLYSLMTACSENKLRGCGCNNEVYVSPKRRRYIQHKIRNPSDIALVQGWSWGGCGSDIKQAVEYSRRFMQSTETTKKPRSLMDDHNNEVGRKVVTNYLRAKCKCHGASGSCATRTCWLIMPVLKEVGSVLKRKYNRAQKVTAMMYGQRAIYLYAANRKQFVKPKQRHLVYLDDSPDYCYEDTNTGITGTKSRQCNATSKHDDSCDSLCCGRGYSEQTYKRTWPCECQFRWCCKVDCNICQEDEGKLVCN